MSAAGYHPFLLERIRADGILQMGELFAADERAVSARVLHCELLESALMLSDERVTAARLAWWSETLLAQPERHPLSAHALGPLLLERLNVVQGLLRVLDSIGGWNTPASEAELWQQSMRLATPIAELVDADPATLAAHGLLFRLRPGLVGPHNPGLCPLDLRARHQMAELPAPAQWPINLRQDWLAGVRRALAQTPAMGRMTRFERTQRALLDLELQRGCRRASWDARQSGRGWRAVWTAWRAALG